MSYPEEIDLAQYIVERFKQLDVKQVFGVPGDFTLELLDFFENDDKLEWVGNANELGAAYAVDGYARVKHSLGVIITTFGVGELSALNGIAGSMAERLPILHLVGVPSTALQEKKAILHHTLGGAGSFESFAQMSSHITSTVGLLKKGGSGESWTAEIDRVLRVALTECRPTYLTLPTDLVHTKVSSKGLMTPLPRPNSAPPAASTHTEKEPEQNTEVLDHVVEEIAKKFEKSKKPVIIVDICADRFGCGQGIRELVEKTGVRFFETPMGKSVVDEQHPNYGGTYVGANSLPAIRKEVEDADFVIMCGRLESDFNSGSFTFDLAPQNTVELHSFETKIGFASYPGCDIRTILPSLTKALEAVVKKNGGFKTTQDKGLIKEGEKQREQAGNVPQPEGELIKHEWLWPRVGEFLQEHDIVLAETGTSNFGIINVPFPSHASCLTQTLWGSIGWATGATLGAALAAKESEHQRRTILFTGDGSIQLSLQEVGTMIRRELNPYLFVLNNDGYEIERQIHGVHAKYNDIQLYDWQKMLPFFAGKSKHPHQSYVVRTPAELDALMKDEDFNKPDRLRLIEIYMPRDDAPKALLGQARLTAEANAKI